mgnify:CR=1 FL=1
MEQKWNVDGVIIVEDSFDYKELLLLCKKYWYWFAISMITIMAIAVSYIIMTPSSYTRTAEVQIKSQSVGRNGAKMQNSFNEMGFTTSNTNLYNELRAMVSADVMFEVVKRLHLDIQYEAEGKLRNEVLFGPKLPVSINFLDLTDYDNVTCCMEVEVERKDFVVLTDFTYHDLDEDIKMESKDRCRIHIGDTSNTPIGRVVISRVPEFSSHKNPKRILVERTNMFTSQELWSSKFSVTQDDVKSDVVTLSLKDISTQRSDATLKEIINVYNENWASDKNQVAIGTSRFISERLKIIESELSMVDSDISSYKSKNMLPDVKTAADLYMQENANISNQLRDLNSQMYMTQYIRDYLSKPDNLNKVLPVSSGIQNSNIESQISEYNEKLLKRNRLETASSSENELVKGMDVDLASLRNAILVSIDNQLTAIDNKIRNLKNSERSALSRISSNPIQAEMLLSAERQQAVKEALYLFLLQKREETELSQAYTAHNTRIIKRPGGHFFPNAPKKKNILFVALMMGILIPLGVCYLKMSMDTTIRGKRDLDQVPVPLLGEIPLVQRTRKWWKFWGKSRRIHTAVVQPGNRNAVNEAFRVLRTNLEFLSNKQSQIIMLTSFNKGSGKSFICVNLAISLAINNKKVLLIDGDMRHGSLSRWVRNPNMGLSTYLNGKIENVEDVLVKSVNGYIGMDVLPIGGIPPNPSELIGNGLFKSLVEDMKMKYDYVFIDCPPVDIVAETQIISNYVDRTLFIVRSGLLERSMLDHITDMYSEKRFRNMSLIMNGTALEGGKYSYRYGYHSDYYNA